MKFSSHVTVAVKYLFLGDKDGFSDGLKFLFISWFIEGIAAFVDGEWNRNDRFEDGDSYPPR